MVGMLYYPGTIPPEPVVYQAVLYWDFLSTIAPVEYEPVPGDTLHQIRDAGLYEPLNLHSDRYRSDLDRAFSADLRLLERRFGLDRLLPSEADVAAANTGTDSNDLTWYSLRRFPTDLTERIIGAGLGAWRVPGEQIWVTPAVRQLLFAIAADYIVDRTARSDEFVAGKTLFSYTDRDNFFWAGHRPLPDEAGHTVDPRWAPHPCWQVEMGGLFPIPAPGTPLDRVIAFRQRYDAERRRLIKAVSTLKHQLHQQAGSPKEVMADLRQELDDAVSDLAAAARAAKLAWVKRSTLVFIAVGAAASIGALPALGFLLGVIGGVAVNLATNQIAGASEQSRKFTYLYQASRQLPVISTH
jgi:hypothetical protein